MISLCPPTSTPLHACGVDDDAGFSILFPGWVTSTERYWVTSRKQRRTAWTKLLRPPYNLSAGACYRFVLSNPAVNVCLMAPRSRREFDENLAEIRKGPLSEEEPAFMRTR